MQVSEEEATAFCVRCLEAAGACGVAARDMAALLVAADLAGHHSHGMNRLEFYVNDLLKGYVDAAATPEVLKETAATAWVDGHRALGATVGHFCMDLAIKKAKDVGVGIVSVKGSSHYGMAGYWAEKAEREGMIGMSFTNTSPVVVPTRSKEVATGTNPIAVAAPGADEDRFLLDMATSAVSLGKVEIKRRAGETMPAGWALDEEGNPTTDPELAFLSRKLLPLGGLEETSGYKGYALSVAVEILCGILAGANYGPAVPQWACDHTDKPQDLAQCFIALDVGCFAPGFRDRLSDLTRQLRTLPRLEQEREVLVPGDRRRREQHAVRMRGHLQYGDNQAASCRQLAELLSVPPIRTIRDTTQL